MVRQAGMGLSAIVLVAAGCAGPQTPLDPAGPQAARVESLWWLHVAVACGVFGAVVLAGAIGLARPRAGGPAGPEVHPEGRRERAAGLVAVSAVGLTVALLLVLLAGDFVTGRSLQSMEREASLPIRITGHQWWWDVQYEPGGPADIVRTANEIHIPVGRPVRFLLRSDDVIHSFWAPNLGGKKDLIPGHPTGVTVRADRAGAFTGQCAEYCGFQHAHMRFDLIAEPPEQFERWLAAQRAEAPEPRTDAQKRGREVFLTRTCAMCHTINGTAAQSRVGPDLTHVASRRSIAGGSLPNTRGFLAGWLLDPQHLKPGVRMPTQSLSPDDLNALLDYLETLK